MRSRVVRYVMPYILQHLQLNFSQLNDLLSRLLIETRFFMIMHISICDDLAALVGTSRSRAALFALGTDPSRWHCFTERIAVQYQVLLTSSCRYICCCDGLQLCKYYNINITTTYCNINISTQILLRGLLVYIGTVSKNDFKYLLINTKLHYTRAT